jgi:hypothetical protein
MVGQEAVRGRVANPHGSLDTPCENCHTTTAWKPIRRQPEFNHNTQTKFALLGLHQNVACTSCHVNLEFAKASTRCSECHADLHRRQFGPNCQDCHTVKGWGVEISAIRDHNNRFPLLGAHAVATCDDCHKGAAVGVYIGLSTQCVSCHLKDYQTGTPLNHVAANLPTTCETCHQVTVWQNARFNHNQFTSFALTGAHAAAACIQCHVGNRFAGTPTDCYSCHINDFKSATNPNHVTAGFPQNCASCHTTLSWQGATFDHSTTGFALTGLHTTVQCAQCHLNNNYNLTSGACSACHLQDYANTTNPNHRTANFSTTCETCHNTTGWQNATFDHNLASFKLTGAHSTVACAQCHLNGDFTNSPTQCAGCHLPDFRSTNAPNHVQAGFPTTCDSCHTTAPGWGGANFNHSSTGFTLTGAHTSVQCQQCHSSQFGNYSIPNGACGQCHMVDFNGATNPNHVQAGFPTTCDTCHTTAPGWGGANFNHSSTGFTLTGTHTTLQCQQCHNAQFGNYSISSGQCWNCHQNDYNTTTNPSHKATNFPQDCSGCHTTVNWLGATFNHATTGFTLVGLHATQQCAACHVNNNYSLASGACWNCHQPDYAGANNPPHAAAGFPTDCTLCHGTSITNWTSATFNHSTTGFALTGTHTTVQCAQCHVNNNYSLSSGACWNCHQVDYNGTTNPPHKATNFPQDCSGCHTTVNWLGATFNHSTTGFTLVGVHATQQCAACHVNNNYTLNSTACITCHLADFNGTTNPPHQSSAFPTDCTICHGTSITNWTSATFDHSTTGFALTGAHLTLQCSLCHNATNGNYNLTASQTACWTCHQTDYNGATNPPHLAANFPHTCDTCHTTVAGWGGATFNHATQENFPLTGAHATLQCTQCHNATFGNYSIASTACALCHMTDYNGTNNPPHQTAGFPTTCDTCHTTVAGWGGATFTHPSTPLSLTGYHATMLSSNQCTLCHTGATPYVNTPSDCWSCHQNDYNTLATNPPHAAQGFPHDCSQCHTFVDWSGATFNHTSTGFALTGAHTTQPCTACHTATLGYNITPAQAVCWTCHQADYNGTTNPPHATAGFPQDCSQCHSTNATTPPWAGATFTHPAAPMALTGYHATMLTNNQCNLCHLGPTPYTNTTTVCYTCHTTDFNNTTNPGHVAAGFGPPTYTCDNCHTFVDWTGAKYTAHDSKDFPIYSGTHNGKWQNCTDCHTSSTNYTTSTLTCMSGTCHPQTQTNNNHQGVKNYVYAGPNCYQCHPKGNGG